MGRSRSTPGLVESKGKVPVSESELAKKELTSASTATLLTDDECDKMASIERTTTEAAETGSMASEEASTQKPSSRHPSQQQQPAISKSLTPQQLHQVLSNQSALIYPAPAAHLLPPNVTLMNFDNRVQQSALYPAPQIPFYTGHSQQYSPFCGLSPAASTNHLSIPSNLAVGTSSPTNFISEDNSAVAIGLPLSNQTEGQSQDAMLSEIKRLRERLLTLETENASMSMKLNQQQWQVENR